MQFPHLFDFIQIYDKAFFICVVLLYALSAKDSQMVGAEEMLDSLIMFFTKEAIYTPIIFKI
jgi:hypothetical protein